MISGSYMGGVSFFKGLGGGKYAAAKALTLTNGKSFGDNPAQSECLGDFDGDGNLDMVLGFITGNVKLFKGNGKLQFEPGVDLTAGGKPIAANDGGPCLTDWDGDGKLDLLMGDGEGNVKFYKGKGHGSTDFAAPASLISVPAGRAWEPRKIDAKSATGFSPMNPGIRLKPFAADWNGDGKLDLIVGDFVQIARPTKTLSAAEKSKKARLQKQMNEQMQAYSAAYVSMRNRVLKEMQLSNTRNLSVEQQVKISKRVQELMDSDKQVLKKRESYVAAVNLMRPYQDQPEMTGLVWVYLRN